MKDTPKQAELIMDERVKPSIQSVRRRLFVEQDGEEENVCNHIREDSQRKAEEDMKKWNFDFKRGVPLPGRYEWIKLDEHGNEISDSTNLVNEEQSQNEQTEQIEQREINARRNDEPADETATYENS
ncbi:cyclin-dependent kinase inhibitor 1-like isoform X1 [Nylanderia fulva]|uniref:cyclin-dependent kinase inhibitor 1-like isoform X1 n=2 Tax=Nylanderia fulva TaxID=613905 RepID=UPI0010FBAA78|nr:cyclin-dependent kinase inhibitor 1-like isoform X1 [Nylanderia fulva]XP_029173859.1 cyclin-dependent kinase inhibitor 1-like isoform X1 [Nylanderia fulva]